MKSTIVIAALVATALGVTAVVPASAQDAPAPAKPAATAPDQTPSPMHRMWRKGGGPGGMMNRMQGGSRLLALACSDRGAAVLGRLLDRTATRLDLTADQQKLFDAFRAKAVASETGFAAACKVARPDRSAGRPDMIERLQAGLAVDQARITALNAVLPDFKALFDSLSPQQKAHLRPHWMAMGGMGPNGGKPHHWGKGGAAPASTT